MTLRTLNYGNYGIFLIMGSAGFCPSTLGPSSPEPLESTLEFPDPRRSPNLGPYTTKGTLPKGPKVVPFGGSYLEFYKVLPKRNYFGAFGYRNPH